MSNSLPAPKPNQAYMHVSALQAGTIKLPKDVIIAGHEHVYHKCPSLAFYLEHSATKKNVVFDLGLRKDKQSYPPEARAHYLDSNFMPCDIPQDVAESLVKGGVDPANIEQVVISHLHFDHIGDHRPFTKATFLMGSDAEEHITGGFPGDPKSPYLTDSVPADRTFYLNRSEHFVAPGIGPFPLAYDVFGDGALYLIDTPGHCCGHLTGLARISPDGHWLYFGADICHDTRLLTDHTTDIAEKMASGAPYCMHRDTKLAREDIRRARELVKLPKVEFLIAHDHEWMAANIENGPYLPKRYVPKA